MAVRRTLLYEANDPRRGTRPGAFNAFLNRLAEPITQIKERPGILSFSAECTMQIFCYGDFESKRSSPF